jgi:topoisomerase-4 subunit A
LKKSQSLLFYQKKVRALRGHNIDANAQSFKADDSLKLAIKCETTDKLLMLTTNGKIYTLGADKLPGGRGHGEPIRIIVDIEEGHDIVDIFVHKAGAKRLIASNIGNGFVVEETAMIANTRKGKQVLNVSGAAEAKLCVPVIGDSIAVIGQNRKLLIFPLNQLPQMGRGKGVRLQKYKDGGVSDIKTFNSIAGLSWIDSSERTYVRSIEELRDWQGERAQAGRQPPTGFPKNNKFTG